MISEDVLDILIKAPSGGVAQTVEKARTDLTRFGLFLSYYGCLIIFDRGRSCDMIILRKS